MALRAGAKRHHQRTREADRGNIGERQRRQAQHVGRKGEEQEEAAPIL
jgi:hypothetical protein